MSEPIAPPADFAGSDIFQNPVDVPPPPPLTDRNEIVATASPVQLGGDIPPVGNEFTWTTLPAPPGEVNQVVLSGRGIALNVGTGAAVINAIGVGLIIESVQNSAEDEGGNPAPIPDAGKFIQLGDPEVGYDLVPINTNFEVGGNTLGQKETISQAAGGQVPPGGFGFYVHGGTGNDTLVGSTFADFIRGGAGDDAINAGNGDDLVRGGDGSDRVTLGDGADVMYYTSDQVVDNDLDVVTDFKSGVDKIRIAQGLNYTISNDRRTVVLSNPVNPDVQTVLRSDLDLFQDTDISFVI